MLAVTNLGLGQGIACAPGIETLPDTILLSTVWAYHRFNLVQGRIPTVWTKQASRLLDTDNPLVQSRFM